MKLIQTLCCSALINPLYPMVEVSNPQYLISLRLLRLLAALVAGGSIAQALAYLTFYLMMDDSQAAGMMGDLVIQHLSYYFLGCAFIILSLSNMLIKRGISRLKAVRLPSLILISCVAVVSFLLIPRIDYLRETALQDGMPVMLSPLANYFVMLTSLSLILISLQIFSGLLMAWRLTNTKLS